MGLKVKALHVGDILMDWSFLLFGLQSGKEDLYSYQFLPDPWC